MGSHSETPVHIPVIDISAANGDAPRQLLDAACQFGFVFVANNEAGIPPALIAQLFDISSQFFQLPTNVKEQVSIASNKAGKNHGWLSQGVEKLDPTTQPRPDVKEAFNMGSPRGGEEGKDKVYDQPLPDIIHQHLQTVTAFHTACFSLCQRILTHFAMALEIPSDWFTTRHDHTAGEPNGSVLRLLYYPRRTSTNDEVDIRAGAHSDYGSVTCLFQLPGQPGLEIKTPSGEWAAVPVDPLGTGERDALPILVNIGDLLEDWTGGLLKSTKHRVVFPTSAEQGDRFSIAYFCHPLDEALLEPVPSRLVERHCRVHGRKMEGDGRVITARDHLTERLAATYKIK